LFSSINIAFIENKINTKSVTTKEINTQIVLTDNNLFVTLYVDIIHYYITLLVQLRLFNS